MFRDFVVLEVGDTVIAGWLYRPGEEPPYPAVCVCHGVPSGSPPDPGDGGYPLLAEKICREGFAVLIFNFRGTGDSGGNLDILGWTGDLQAAVDYLWSSGGVDRSHLYLVGFSAGAATSVYVASRDKRVSGVAACACPAEFTLFTEASEPQSVVDRFRNMGVIRDDGFPPSVKEWLNGFREVSPIKHIAGIAPRPLLLLHGSGDELVPVSHVRRLYEKAREPKKLVIIDGAGHRLRQDDRAISVVLDWLKSRID
jgi:dipeptidyl aminopeptidase/acylaminoacyl peptidase